MSENIDPASRSQSLTTPDMSKVRKVGIVLSKANCRLAALIEEMPVWAPKSEQNELMAPKLREVIPDSYLTLFNADFEMPPEDEFLCLLPTVDLHHGEYAVNGPWEVLEVFGVGATDRIKEALEDYGVKSVENTGEGFRATRPAGFESKEEQ